MSLSTNDITKQVVGFHESYVCLSMLKLMKSLLLNCIHKESFDNMSRIVEEIESTRIAECVDYKSVVRAMDFINDHSDEISERTIVKMFYDYIMNVYPKWLIIPVINIEFKDYIKKVEVTLDNNDIVDVTNYLSLECDGLSQGHLEFLIKKWIEKNKGINIKEWEQHLVGESS